MEEKKSDRVSKWVGIGVIVAVTLIVFAIIAILVLGPDLKFLLPGP